MTASSPFNRVKVATATIGNGTATLGAAATGYCTAAEAGVSNGATVSYLIEDGNDFEIGQGVYSSAGTTLTRATVRLSKIAGVAGTTKLTLSGSAIVSMVLAAEDIAAFTPPVAASQADQETATDLVTFVPPGRMVHSPYVAKAWLSATVTPTAVAGALNSNTSTIITWNTTHGLTTGDTIIIDSSSWPSPLNTKSPYYVNVLSTTTFRLYTTLADALADTNRISLTGGSGTRAMHKLVFTNVLSKGMSSVSPVSGIVGQTDIALVFNLSPSLSSSVAACFMECSGLFDNAGQVAGYGIGHGVPDSLSAAAVTYSSLLVHRNNAYNRPTGNWGHQFDEAFRVTFVAFGDLA